MKRTKTKIGKLRAKWFWKKGGGELLGFVVITPFIILLICAVVASAQIALTNQNLNYCAYNSCRAAVVSDSYDIGMVRAQEIYNIEMGSANAQANGYTSCELTVLDGADWEKGSYVKCTVRYYIQTFMPFTSGVREQSIVMMIENGDA